MPDEKAEIKMLTVQEANATLPQVVIILKSLRDLRDRILRIQAQIEIEEMTGLGAKGQLTLEAQSAITVQMDEFQILTRQFENGLESLFKLGALLKDLNRGLVDFYSLRKGEIVFLCWIEGENEIQHWHTLEGGFQNRHLLD